jgi:hypothetical protein
MDRIAELSRQLGTEAVFLLFFGKTPQPGE